MNKIPRPALHLPKGFLTAVLLMLTAPFALVSLTAKKKAEKTALAAAPGAVIQAELEVEIVAGNGKVLDVDKDDAKDCATGRHGTGFAFGANLSCRSPI